MRLHNFAVALSVTALIAGCGPVGPKTDTEAENIKAQTGRFQFIDAKGAYPAVVFDSATGCAQALYAVTEGKNAGNLQYAGVIGQEGVCDLLPVAKFKSEGTK